MNLPWQPPPRPEGDHDRSAARRRTFVWAARLHGVAVTASISGLIALVATASRTPRTVLVLPDGRAYTGAPGILPADPVIAIRLARAIVEAAFLRTSGGTPAILEAFIAPAARSEIAHQSGPADHDAYHQELRVLDLRPVSTGDHRAEVHLRARLRSRSMRDARDNEVFLAAELRRGAPEPDNPLGWRLHGLVRMSEAQFTAGERAARVRAEIDALAPGGDPAASP